MFWWRRSLNFELCIADSENSRLRPRKKILRRPECLLRRSQNCSTIWSGHQPWSDLFIILPIHYFSFPWASHILPEYGWLLQQKKQTRNVVSILDNWSSVLFSGLGLCRSLHAETLKTRKMSKKQTTKYRSIDEVMRLSYRSRTRVQKAAQVARRMGRSLVEFRALTHSRQLRRLTRKGNLKVKHPQGLKNCAGCTRKDHFKFPFVSVSKWLQE